jgi:hypothetical protein
MPRHHYYSSTARNNKDIANYFVFNLSQFLGLVLFKGNELQASALAGAVTTAYYSSVTTSFFGQEARSLDIIARDAVSAELGVDPKDLKFSDYWRSNNVVVKKECEDLSRVTKYRYLTDAIFALPVALLFVSKAFPGSKDMLARITHMGLEPSKNGKLDPLKLTGFTNLLATIGYAGKSFYWVQETFNLDKTGMYEFVKLHETIVSLGKHAEFNDILPLLQRTRDDRGVKRLNQQEVLAYEPVVNLLVDKYNRGNIGPGELLYLIGNHKLRIHGLDDSISQQEIKNSIAFIEHIDKVGLDGIREENRNLHAEHPDLSLVAKRTEAPSYVARIGDRFIPAQRSKPEIGALRSAGLYEERISSRDPTEFVYSGR